ncbi:general substrate transporter, partial [Violaceomyces palustris]
IFGVVKLVASLVCMIFLIDVIGRRRSVLLGISLQTLAALYLTIYLAILNPSEEGKDLSGGERRASIGAVAMIFLSGVAWALGFNAIQYLVGTEIFPIRVRATATSLIMAVHFSQQYGSSRALQPMLKAMDRWGLFALWTSVGVVAAIYILLLVPETAGRSLEEMEELFETP